MGTSSKDKPSSWLCCFPSYQAEGCTQGLGTGPPWALVLEEQDWESPWLAGPLGYQKPALPSTFEQTLGGGL